VTEVLRRLDKTDDGSKPLKLTSDASMLSAELLRLFVRGALFSASMQTLVCKLQWIFFLAGLMSCMRLLLKLGNQLLLYLR